MRSIISHGHIFKNAGSTLDWSLARNLGANFLDHRDDKGIRTDTLATLQSLLSKTPNLKAISSHHLPQPLPAIDGITFHYVYLLRHPLARILSVYHFEHKQDSDSLGAKAAKNLSLREYVMWRMQPDVPATIRNYQTRYLAGFHVRSPHLEITPQAFGEAITHLRKGAVVGIVENYDESMVVIEDYFRRQSIELDLSYVRQNTGSSYASGNAAARTAALANELDQETLDCVLRENSLDLALYYEAKTKLSECCNKIDNFSGKLLDFRARCRALNE